MIFGLFSIFYFYAKSIFFYKFGLIKQNKRLYYIGKSFHRITYRYHESAKKDILITLRVYKYLYQAIINKPLSFPISNGNAEYAVFDISLSNKELRINYITEFSGVKPGHFFSRDNLLTYNGLGMYVATLVFLIATFIPVQLLSVFSKNKLNAPLVIRECLECYYLLQNLKKAKVKNLDYFCIYERDSNACAQVLMNNGVYVNKIPSEVPLIFFNKIIVSDKISFCFKYQQEEFNAYHESMFVDQTQIWAPETILEAPKRFLLKPREKSEQFFEIGFFSSGNWLRKHKGEADLGHNDSGNEEAILKTVIQYAKDRQYRLRIYTHPVEKRYYDLSAVKNYYHKLIANEALVTLEDFNLSSIEGFDKINIAVSLYSTLMFERIYLGFKTILAPFNYPEFPISNSMFCNICAHNTESLIEMLDKNMKYDTDEFFINNQLNGYTGYLNA